MNELREENRNKINAIGQGKHKMGLSLISTSLRQQLNHFFRRVKSNFNSRFMTALTYNHTQSYVERNGSTMTSNV